MHEDAHGNDDNARLEKSSQNLDLLRILTNAPTFQQGHQASYKAAASYIFDHYDK